MRSSSTIVLWIVVLSFSRFAACQYSCPDSMAHKEAKKAADNMSTKLGLRVEQKENSSFLFTNELIFGTTTKLNLVVSNIDFRHVNVYATQKEYEENNLSSLKLIYERAYLSELGCSNSNWLPIQPKNFSLSYISAFVLPSYSVYYTYDSPLFSPKLKKIAAIVCGMLDGVFVGSYVYQKNNHLSVEMSL
ncbi:MAG: hypothetical protein JNL74_12065, partial [Fibrobacteres bacterium]|nr:hypothetical protein [Fibrobacterota bacterium]